MALRSYFFGLFCATLLSFGVWLAIFFYADPKLADFLTFGAFFSSLFLWLTGIFTFILFYIRISIAKSEVQLNHLPIAIRHSALIAVAIVGILVFQTLKVLSIWEMVLMLLIIILVELAARAKRKKIS